MVFLVLTRGGYDQLRAALGKVPSPMWVADGVLTQPEINEMRAAGITVTDFDYSANPGDASEVEDMFSTVALHHPKQVIWVERLGETR